ncbi:hypothetical protein HYH03_013440 [Edaphochlamys debaryana]|uniref:Protein kinase domain-containing protein n=1 Tax=Edaphochlamys debaryana TaxID=47281 RepID=A0A835XS74_9CHLO|nr:hypothetical protein HYH03_013440 [Edaphochlamys debaryana]|eukprot:KAG2488003.1 hypothetical protein HYH03_013440 [Edaphochlamys debaryana]
MAETTVTGASSTVLSCGIPAADDASSVAAYAATSLELYSRSIDPAVTVVFLLGSVKLLLADWSRPLTLRRNLTWTSAACLRSEGLVAEVDCTALPAGAFVLAAGVSLTWDHVVIRNSLPITAFISPAPNIINGTPVTNPDGSRGAPTRQALPPSMLVWLGAAVVRRVGADPRITMPPEWIADRVPGLPGPNLVTFGPSCIRSDARPGPTCYNATARLQDVAKMVPVATGVYNDNPNLALGGYVLWMRDSVLAMENVVGPECYTRRPLEMCIRDLQAQLDAAAPAGGAASSPPPPALSSASAPPAQDAGASGGSGASTGSSGGGGHDSQTVVVAAVPAVVGGLVLAAITALLVLLLVRRRRRHAAAAAAAKDAGAFGVDGGADSAAAGVCPEATGMVTIAVHDQPGGGGGSGPGGAGGQILSVIQMVFGGGSTRGGGDGSPDGAARHGGGSHPRPSCGSRPGSGRIAGGGGGGGGSRPGSKAAVSGPDAPPPGTATAPPSAKGSGASGGAVSKEGKGSLPDDSRRGAAPSASSSSKETSGGVSALSASTSSTRTQPSGALLRTAPAGLPMPCVGPQELHADAGLPLDGAAIPIGRSGGIVYHQLEDTAQGAGPYQGLGQGPPAASGPKDDSASHPSRRQGPSELEDTAQGATGDDASARALAPGPAPAGQNAPVTEASPNATAATAGSGGRQQSRSRRLLANVRAPGGRLTAAPSLGAGFALPLEPLSASFTLDGSDGVLLDLGAVNDLLLTGDMGDLSQLDLNASLGASLSRAMQGLEAYAANAADVRARLSAAAQSGSGASDAARSGRRRQGQGLALGRSAASMVMSPPLGPPRLPLPAGGERTSQQRRDGVWASANSTGAQSTGGASAAPVDQLLVQLADVRRTLATSGINDTQLCIEGLLGTGFYGTVYLGTWKGLRVAVKSLVFSTASASRDRALKEAALCQQISHPCIIATYAVDVQPVVRPSSTAAPGAAAGQPGPAAADAPAAAGQAAATAAPGATGPASAAGSEASRAASTATEWRLLLLQEYADLGPLSLLVHSHWLMTPGGPAMHLLVELAHGIASALAHLHERNVVHGDLTPNNVLLKSDPARPCGIMPKVADLGLSVAMPRNATHLSNYRFGTPYYTSPEVLRQGVVSCLSDVYSYGVLLWEMYSGRFVCELLPDGSFTQAPGFPALPAAAPQPFAALLRACVNPSPNRRPPMTAILSALEAMYNDPAVVGPAHVPPHVLGHEPGTQASVVYEAAVQPQAHAPPPPQPAAPQAGPPPQPAAAPAAAAAAAAAPAIAAPAAPGLAAALPPDAPVQVQAPVALPAEAAEQGGLLPGLTAAADKAPGGRTTETRLVAEEEVKSAMAAAAAVAARAAANKEGHAASDSEDPGARMEQGGTESMESALSSAPGDQQRMPGRQAESPEH